MLSFLRETAYFRAFCPDVLQCRICIVSIIRAAVFAAVVGVFLWLSRKISCKHAVKHSVNY